MLSGHLCFLFGEMSIQVLCPFLIGLLHFLLSFDLFEIVNLIVTSESPLHLAIFLLTHAGATLV